MTLFELVAKISADSSGFEKAVNQADKQGKTLKDSLSNTFDKIGKLAVAAFSGAAIKKGIDTMIALANETAAAGDKIDKQSQVLGLSRKAYQEWDYILSQNGASIDSMSTSMKTMNNLILNAAAGSEEAKDTFAELGLGIHEIENLSPEEQFEAIIRAFQKMPAGAEKSALAVKIFGKAGMDLLPLLNQSSDSIDELRQNAEDLGFLMSDEAIDASVAYGDAMDDMKRTFGGIKNAIVASFLPKFTSAMKGITSYAGKLKKAYDKKGFAGVWETLVEDFKKIKWPSWKDVQAAAMRAWDSIREGAKNLAGLVFGKKEDGSVDWPTWSDVVEKATEIWNGIKERALNFAGLVFGKKADGSVNWPTWDDVQEKAHEIWLEIKKQAREIGGIIFGKKEDGSIAWPDIVKLTEDFGVWWRETAAPALQKGMAWTLTLFGMPTETAEQIAAAVGEWWSAKVESAQKALTWFLKLPSMPPYDAGQELRKLIIGWWDGIKESASGLLKWFIKIPSFQTGDGVKMSEKIKGWWRDYVVPLITDKLNFLLGLFDLPDAEEMKKKIETWWSNVKTLVGELVLDIIPNILGIGQTGNGDYHPGDNAGYMPDGVSWDIPGNAKGVHTVPYDNYITRLHRGEEVLTASQARQRRNGGNVDLSQVASAVASAVQTGMSDASVNSYLDGKRVTGSVNRRTMTQLRARRFAVS